MFARRTRLALALSITSLAAVAAFLAFGPVGAARAQEPGAKAGSRRRSDGRRRFEEDR